MVHSPFVHCLPVADLWNSLFCTETGEAGSCEEVNREMATSARFVDGVEFAVELVCGGV